MNGEETEGKVTRMKEIGRQDFADIALMRRRGEDMSSETIKHERSKVFVKRLLSLKGLLTRLIPPDRHQQEIFQRICER